MAAVVPLHGSTSEAVCVPAEQAALSEKGILTIAVSSRSLFAQEDEHQVFEMHGQDAYDGLMLKMEDSPLPKGVAFPVIQRLLALNTPGKRDRVAIVVLSRNSAAAMRRVMRSIEAYGLDIQRAVFTTGEDRFGYAMAFKVDLFLSANRDDVEAALRAGIAAAQMKPRMGVKDTDDPAVRIALDGDNVLFSGASEAVYQSQGMASFVEHEQRLASVCMDPGPLRRFVGKLAEVRRSLGPQASLLKLGLFTARGVSTHERAMQTLDSWGIHIDVGAFCDGEEKGPIVRAFGAQIHFDDHEGHAASVERNDVAAGLVLRLDAVQRDRAPEQALETTGTTAKTTT